MHFQGSTINLWQWQWKWVFTDTLLTVAPVNMTSHKVIRCQALWVGELPRFFKMVGQPMWLDSFPSLGIDG
jgi:hypothetical protein